jgi:sugar phosphate isomerase/epimerase
MARLSINELTTYRWSFEQDVLRSAAAGYEAIGVWRPKLADYGEDKGRELLLETGLAVSNLLWAGGFTGSDDRSFVDAVDDAVDAIRLAAEIEAGCLIVYSGSAASHTTRHARRLFASALEELLPVAADYKVDLALEIMHTACAQPWTMVTNISDALELLDEFNHPRLKLALDTFHMGRDEALRTKLESIAGDIAVVHLADGRGEPTEDQQRCPLGEGDVPLGEIVAALTAAGYDGDYDVELFGEEIEQLEYEVLLEQTKDAFAALQSGVPAIDM